VGPGDEDRGPGLLPVPPARRQARGTPGRGQHGAGEAAVAGEVRAIDSCALRDGLPRLLRLSPGGRDRADREPVPAGPAGLGARAPLPGEAFPKQKAGLFRPKVPQRVPKQIPDAVFNELFARLGSHRDRALVAFWVSAGARASELLSVTRSGADPGQQLITVIRKGSRAIQQLPASPDAFVWLRLYQQEVHGLVPAGPDDPLWWTLRRPFRPLTYDTARKMFDRANDAAGTGWTLHSLRHTAAYRLARDPDMPITDVQWVLGHALLSTTQIYVVPTAEDVIEATLAHYRRRAEPGPAPAGPAPGYRPESLDVLFGKGRW
jgi:integrase